MKVRALIFSIMLVILPPVHGTLIEKVTLYPVTLPEKLHLPTADQLHLFSLSSPTKRSIPTFGALTGNRAFINLVEEVSPSPDIRAYFTAYTFDFSDDGIGTLYPVQKDGSVVVTGRAYDSKTTSLTAFGASVWGNGYINSDTFINAVPVTFNCDNPATCQMTNINPGSYYLHNKTLSRGSFEQILSQSDNFRFMYYGVTYHSSEYNEICKKSFVCILLSSSVGGGAPVSLFNQTASSLKVLSNPYATTMVAVEENYGWDLTLYKAEQELQKIKKKLHIDSDGKNIHKDEDLKPLALSNDGKNIYLTYTAEGNLCLTKIPLDGSFLQLPNRCDVEITGEPERAYIWQMSLTEEEDYGVLFGPAGGHSLDPWKPYTGFFYNIPDTEVLAFSELIKMSDKPDLFDLGHDMVPEQIHRDAKDENVLWVTVVGTALASGKLQAAMVRIKLEADVMQHKR